MSKLADELWEKYHQYSGVIVKDDFLAAITTAMQEVRRRDAEIAMRHADPSAGIIAAAIEREELP